MNIGRILFLAIFLFSVSTVLAISTFAEKIINDSTLEIRSKTALIDKLGRQNMLKQKYQQQLLEVLSQFKGENISFNSLEDKLLDLTVPAEYKDLHLNLVAAINQLADKQSNYSAQAKLEQLKDAYGWLTGNLTLFIANNF